MSERPTHAEIDVAIETHAQEVEEQEVLKLAEECHIDDPYLQMTWESRRVAVQEFAAKLREKDAETLAELQEVERMRDEEIASLREKHGECLGTILDMEIREKMLVDGLKTISSEYAKKGYFSGANAINELVSMSPSSTSECTARFVAEWLRTNAIPVVYMQSTHLDGFVHRACGTDSMLARCSYRKLHTDYKPLFAIPDKE